jgi:hypothetical protein
MMARMLSGHCHEDVCILCKKRTGGCVCVRARTCARARAVRAEHPNQIRDNQIRDTLSRWQVQRTSDCHTDSRTQRKGVEPA